MSAVVEQTPPKGSVLFAHGAGAGMDSPFLQVVSDELQASGFRVMRFEFPYMQAMRALGRRRPPDRMPKLMKSMREHWYRLDARGPRVVMGKSMGGRVAMMMADELGAQACVVLGYPLHPAGQPDKKRLEPLQAVRCPTLIIQGERDAMGNRQDWQPLVLSTSVRMCWVTGGDHSLVPKQSLCCSKEDAWRRAASTVCDFLDEVCHVAG